IWIGSSSLWEGTFGHASVAHWSFWSASPIAASSGVLSIIGDSFESLLKRRAGRKDSSASSPGHGGVYDRIDAISPVAPLALILSGVTSDVIARHPDRSAVYASSAYSRMERSAEQASASRAAVVVVPDARARDKFVAAWPAGQATPEIRVGAQASADTAADAQCDAVMA
ncbi:hypothetical protein OY671_009873, partial [Metschnikowia pulcherrima]